LELAQKLTKEVKNLNIIYEKECRNGQKADVPALLRYIVGEALRDDNWFEFYRDVLSKQDGKININAIVSFDGTALSYACKGRDIDVANLPLERKVVDLLLEYKADVNKVNYLRNRAPIYFALEKNDYNLASLLFKHGAKIDITSKLEQAIIANSYSEKNKYTKETMEVLLQHTSSEQNTEIQRRYSGNNNSANEDIKIMKLLSDKLADPNINIGELNAMQIDTDKNNTRLIDLSSPRQVSTDIPSNEEMDQEMGTQNSFEDAFPNFINTKRNNPDQSSLLSESYASWYTSWEDSITESGSFPSYQGERLREHVQKGVANSPRLDNVHSILSMQQQQLFDCSNNPFSMSCLSIQEQESLESNSASIQHSLQLRKRPLYDVDKKVFNSIDYRMNAEFHEHERSEQGFLVLNKSLSNNSKEVKSNWVFQSSEVIQPKTQSQDLNDKDAKFSNNNSALVSSFGQANIVPMQVIQSVIDKTTHNNSTEQSALQLEQAGFNKNPLENTFQISKGENRRFLDEIRNKKKEKFAEELKEIKYQFAKKEEELDIAKENVLQLEEELKETKAQLEENAEEISKLNGQVTQLIEKEKVLDGAKKEVSRLESTQHDLAKKINELEITQAQLERKCGSVQQDLGAKIEELESTNQKVLRLEQERDSAQQDLAAKTKEFESAKIQLKKLQKGLDEKTEALKSGNDNLKTKKLESRNEELNGKNKKFSAVSAQSRKQVTYASVSFVLSGAFAVGASLIMFHLAICITLAVAALTFLAVGCYCSYKANTALSNVEVKNGVNPAVMEV